MLPDATPLEVAARHVRAMPRRTQLIVAGAAILVLLTLVAPVASVATCRRGREFVLRSMRDFCAAAQAPVQAPRRVRSARAHLGGRHGHAVARASARTRRAPRRAEGHPARARAQQGVHRDVSRRGGESRRACRIRTSSPSTGWGTTAVNTSSRWRCCGVEASSSSGRPRGTRRSPSARDRRVDWRTHRRRTSPCARDGRRRGQPQSVVHRDVNPANIFVTRGGVPKLIDFGLAKARDRLASTAIGVVKGKLAYLAPEQKSRDTRPTAAPTCLRRGDPLGAHPRPAPVP